MKKIALPLLAFSLLSQAAHAQGFYVRAALGYAFAQAGQSMYDTPIPYNGFPTAINGTRNNATSGQSLTYNIKTGASYSAGLQGTVGLGYMFSRHAGMQLDAVIGISPKEYTFTDNNVNLNTTASPLPGTITTTHKAKSPAFLIPSLVLQTGGDKVNLYSRFGLALPLSTKVTQVQTISNLPGAGRQVVTNYSWEIKSSFSMGFSAAAGIKLKLNPSVTVFGEVSLLSMSANVKQQDLKELKQDGVSYPLAYYSYAQSIKFSKTATFDTTFSSFPTYSQPFSNVGVNVGISFTLGKRTNRGNTANREADRRETPNRPRSGNFR